MILVWHGRDTFMRAPPANPSNVAGGAYPILAVPSRPLACHRRGRRFVRITKRKAPAAVPVRLAA
jgi:hypothetical protein